MKQGTLYSKDRAFLIAGKPDPLDLPIKTPGLLHPGAKLMEIYAEDP